MSISDKALLHVLKLLEESDNVSIDVESEGLRLTARRGNATSISQSPVAVEATYGEKIVNEDVRQPGNSIPEPAISNAEQETALEENSIVVLRSPMKGTFYRAPAPGEPPFCDLGDKVGSDDTVCLVEIMKLFNSIPAGVSGTVEAFFVENADPVDLNQAIVSIRVD